MARLASLTRLGYYPTPPEVTALIASNLRKADGYGTAYGFDGFAGEGTALLALCRALDLVPEANELHTGRYDELLANMTQFHDTAPEGTQGHIRKLNTPTNSAAEFLEMDNAAQFILTNPPYDQRIEISYTRQMLNFLMGGGVNAIVIPETSISEDFVVHLLAQYSDVHIRRFPAPHYDRFKQVVIFATRRERMRSYVHYEAGKLYEKIATGDIPDLVAGEFAFIIPLGPRPRVKAKDRVVVQALAELPDTLDYGVYNTVGWQTLTALGVSASHNRPLMPMQHGHMAAMFAGGALNGARVIINGKPVMLKTRAKRGAEVSHYTRERKQKNRYVSEDMTEAIEHYTTYFHMLDSTGNLETVSSDDPDAFATLIQDNVDVLMGALEAQRPPLYNPDTDLEPFREALAHFHPPSDKPLPGESEARMLDAQVHRAAALAKTTRNGHSKVTILVGRMGTGKTATSMLWDVFSRKEQWLNGGYSIPVPGQGKAEQPLRTVVFAPKHLVLSTWEAEAQACLRDFGVKVFVCTTTGDIDKAFAHDGPAYLVIPESTGKLGSGWVSSFNNRRIPAPKNARNWEFFESITLPSGAEFEYSNAVACPHCDGIIKGDPLDIENSPRRARLRGVQIAQRDNGDGYLFIKSSEMTKRTSKGTIRHERRHCRYCGQPLFQHHRNTPRTKAGKEQVGGFKALGKGDYDYDPRHLGLARHPLGDYLKHHYKGRY